MTAGRYTESTIACNGEGCTRTDFASNYDLPMYHRAADLRKVLRRRGWLCGVSVRGDAHGARGYDFCPQCAAQLKERQGQ